MVDRDKQINQLMKNLLVPMAKCQITCDQVRSKLIMHLQLEKVDGSSSNENDAFGNRRKEKVRIWVHDWMWPFRRKGVFALMSELDRTRSTYPPSDKKLSPHYTKQRGTSKWRLSRHYVRGCEHRAEAYRRSDL
ncbi:uncharacterized protein ASPGLDRAFT_41021 [Aspergillus glaucus CBS 516.65]|uniref:Uncharacterized protein n=1 Tax=Aspergillus glaucus CBS 516.65 TaxID=1160497 RepID=A0A1L9VYV4_ASPGL|nr:hypothetical protein ASPGLDRAFT_41021 [Aspergillus glaucus CBS 516.65]OJJ89092.1 hypothetical protein ASPGLDRAFT_41021 [Aspergillus glaucus CBS 516.65]